MLIPDDEVNARLGSTIAGKYELLRVLGVGGMGAVYEARHRFTERHVALKLMIGKGRDPRNSARLLVEARAASAIGHPAIVDVLDAGQTEDGSPYLVLELLAGTDLQMALEERRLTAMEMVAITVQVLEALHAAHERGIIHRDVKPENVFLTTNDRGEPRVKLLDFGLAKELTAGPDGWKTMDGTALGTPDYMSPEQARGAQVDARTDVWSVGVLLYHGLCGHPPFSEENYNRLLSRILTEDAPHLSRLRPDVPAAIASVVMRALRRERAERWQTAAEMARALREGGARISAADWELVTISSTTPTVSLSGAAPVFAGAGTIVDPPVVAAPAVTVAAATPRRGRALVLIAAFVLVMGVLLALLAALPARESRRAPAPSARRTPRAAVRESSSPRSQPQAVFEAEAAAPAAAAAAADAPEAEPRPLARRKVRRRHSPPSAPATERSRLDPIRSWR
ncbi:MAG: serine/threonine protein kinase [Deltaproteobacteria bacterium]|nr:serine/threonine protein kinase [Deltaproteobacteria bacterium]